LHGIPERYEEHRQKTARIEHTAALQRITIGFLAYHTELFKQFSDNSSFSKWLGDTILGVICKQA
jgi:type I restriction enzyme R subunit